MKTLEEKAAIVTGSARGIGAAIAERLAADGASVIVNYSKSATEAESVAGRIRSAGGRAEVVQADVGDPKQVERLVERALTTLGRLDIVVNNAAAIGFAPLSAVDRGATRAQFATNVHGPLALVQAALPHLPSGGRVINVSSIAQLLPIAGATAYAAAKGALDAMTRTWALELGPRGITVNGVAPGPTDTDAMRANVSQEMKDAMIKRTPLGRIGEPADIAAVVAFLASPDARWVTGHVLTATGGFTP
jgi:3-oxoacyl-[acyl-carrier protein] reductase